MAPESTSISVREAARRLGVHDNTVRRYVDRGLIRADRLPSGVRRIRREDVDAFGAADEASTSFGDRPDRSLAELAAEQGVKPLRSVDDLAVPGLWRSNDEWEAFLAMTYAERDRDR